MLLEERDEMELLVKNQGTAYSIVIEGDFQGLEERLRDIQVEGRKICIVTDTNVSPLYLCEVKQRVEKVAKQVIAVTIPAGEEHKTLDTVREIFSLPLAAVWWETFVVLQQRPIFEEFALSRCQRPCYHRWILALAERQALTLMPTKIWWGPFICPPSSTSMWRH